MTRFICTVILLGTLTMAAAPVLSDALSPGSDFTFKRVKPPSPDASRRITVQIDPEEQRRRMAVPVKLEPLKPTVSDPVTLPSVRAAAAYDWYWQAVSPALGDRQGRYALAMSNLTKGPLGNNVAAPRMQQMQDLVIAHGITILKATIGTEVSPALVLAVIGIESAGKVDAVSPKGARGLMQLIPATADRFGVTDASDPAQNIAGGVAYLNWLMKEFDRDPLMVLAAYNAGEGAVRANGGVPPYAETRDYVPKVLAAWQVAQGLCQTAPELVTDPCVFKVLAAGG